MGHMPVDVAEVLAAYRRIQREIIRTPLVCPERLADRVGGQVWLKLENHQRTGAFKFRGALNCVTLLVRDMGQRERGAGVVTASSGNHGLGMALAARACGIGATVVMPEGAPLVKQEKAKGYGAEVRLHGATYDDAQVYARALAEERGSTYVPSFNHPHIIAGQGTIGLELLRDLPDLETVVAPIGGGGLVSGLAVVLKALVPQARLIGVQAEGAASMVASLQRGAPVELPAIETVADGIAVRRPGDLNFAIVSQLVDEVVTVSDTDILAAMRVLMEEATIVAEPAGAAGVAAILAGRIRVNGTTAVVITGGNVAPSLLQQVLGG